MASGQCDGPISLCVQSPHWHTTPTSVVSYMHWHRLYFLIFSIIFVLFLDSFMMDGRFRCGALCGQTFDSSHTLHRHCPSCILYQQESTMHANLRHKRLLSKSGPASAGSKKMWLQKDNVPLAVREFMATSIRLLSSMVWMAENS